MDSEKELTQGQKMVGLTFNPSGDPLVTEAKELYAKIIDLAYAIGAAEGRQTDRAEFASNAITQAIIGQMMLVKAITYKN